MEMNFVSICQLYFVDGQNANRTNFFERYDFLGFLAPLGSETGIASSISGTMQLTNTGVTVGSRLVGQIDVYMQDSSGGGSTVPDAGIPPDTGPLDPPDAGGTFPDAGFEGEYACLDLICPDGFGCLFDPNQVTPDCVVASNYIGTFNIPSGTAVAVADVTGSNTVVGAWQSTGAVESGSVTVEGQDILYIIISGSSSTTLELYIDLSKINDGVRLIEYFDFAALVANEAGDIVARSISGTLDLAVGLDGSLSGAFSVSLQPEAQGPQPPTGLRLAPYQLR